jgi:hypothetical protein
MPGIYIIHRHLRSFRILIKIIQVVFHSGIYYHKTLHISSTSFLSFCYNNIILLPGKNIQNFLDFSSEGSHYSVNVLDLKVE